MVGSRRWTTPALVWLAVLLPMLALLAAQFRVFCEEQGDCSPPVQVGAWLFLPLLVAWAVVLLVLAARAGRWLMGRSGHPR